jgi:hypothetical protein
MTQWICWIMLLRCQPSVLSHLCKSNILNKIAVLICWSNQSQNFTETNSCKWILKRTCKRYPSKQHVSRPGSWLTDPIFVVWIWRQASSVITTMILKEIDIEMRNTIVKIKVIFEKPEDHYKLRVHLLDWREWGISYLDIQSATVCNKIV